VVGDLYHTGGRYRRRNGQTVALNGLNAHLSNEEHVLWMYRLQVCPHEPAQMADLDGDGCLEIVVPILDSPAGFTFSPMTVRLWTR
jgi:hypothetical protein